MTDIIQTKKTVRNSNQSVPLSDIFFRTLHYWPWLLLSIIVCVGLGFLYVARQPYIYTESASLLIKEEGKGKSTTGGYDEFGEFGLFSNNTNIQNEIMSLKSPDLMEVVVHRLNLDMNYYLPGRFHKIVAFGSTLPVTVALPDFPDNGSLEFTLNINGKDLTIEDLKEPGKDEEETRYTGVMNDTIETSVGPIIVTPNSTYQGADGAQSFTGKLEVQKIPINAAVGSYENRLGVTLDANQGTVINLTFSDQNIQRADEVLSTVIGVYNENWIRDRNQIAVSTSNFINERLAVIEDELGHVDSDISSYKSQLLVPDVGTAAGAYFAENQQLSQEIMSLNNQIQMTRYVRNYLTSGGIDDKPMPTNVGVEDLQIQSQINEYNAKLLERNNLKSKSSEKNPIVQRMDRELTEMRGAMIGSVDNYIIKLQTQMKGLQGARGAATAKLASSPSQEKYLLSVERQQKVKESLYLFLLQKREDNELSQAFSAYNTRVIKKPGASGYARRPDKKMIVFYCFLFGLFAPFAVMYGAQIMNTKVRGRKDVENMTLPMLGEIPQFGKQNMPGKFRLSKNKKTGVDKHEIVVKQGSRDIINEAFRVLRTNVEFSRINKDSSNVMAFTSFNPGSGKSFISVNLGMALALKERKVLVIDGDMRHASTSAYVGSPEVGLSDYLAKNEEDIAKLIVNVPGGDNLQILPVGNMPPNPTELLESPRLKTLIDKLRDHYDYIIIDCPPIEVVADAQILDIVADRTVFVIRAGLFERSMLAELEKLYDNKKFNHMAFILNGTMNNEGRYGYRHTYKYGYGYGYGYGYNYRK